VKIVDWLLNATLVILMVSVLSTGSLAIYLTLKPQRGESATAAPSPTQELTEVSALTPEETVKADVEPRIAFVAGRDSDAAIHTVHTDGSNVRHVSAPDLGFCLFPAWSPDGQHVAYVGAEERPFDDDNAPRDIWISTADGTDHVRVTAGISTTAFVPPTWSPDGTRVAFVTWDETAEGGDPPGIVRIARADSGEIERSLSVPWTTIHQITWSPVENKFLLVTGDPDESRTSVYVLPIDGSEAIGIYRGALMADWAPDGQSIVVGDYTSQEVLVIDAGSGNEWQEPRPIAELVMQPIEITWSPNGTHVAVAITGHHRQGYATNLDVVNLQTGDITVVAEGQGWVGWPSWSPDGGRLVFTWGELSRRPGLPFADLWIYDVASGQSESLTSVDGFEGMGTWSP
jgi:Tol biopolymer transport system component